MPGAPSQLDLPRSGAPVSLLVDYDGTISLADVGDDLLARYVADAAAVAAVDAQYDAGVRGSRDLMRWDMDALPDDPGLLRRTAGAMPQDESLRDLVAVARSLGAAVEVVSDGLGFYVEGNLARLGLGDLPVSTNHNPMAGGAGMQFPYGHPRCFVCGTCKRERVRLHQAAGRVVVFVGDGTSDRYAAAHADVVFAKGKLATICAAEGWPAMLWTRLGEVAGWLRDSLASGALPRAHADVDAWRAGRGSAGRAFICGPEVWGDGRTTPGHAGDPPALPSAPTRRRSRRGSCPGRGAR